MYYLFDGDWQQVHTPIDERACAYGDGFFSTIGVYDGQMLWQTHHKDRIRTGVQVFGFELDIEPLMGHLVKFASQMNEGIIKIIVSRCQQSVRGYGYQDGQCQVWIKAMPSQIYQGVAWIDGVPVQPAMQIGCLPDALPTRIPALCGVKLIACPEQVLAVARLQQIQQDNPSISDALLGDVRGEWISGTTGNVLYRLDGQWYTPPITHAGVAGVMRAVLCQRYAIRERRLIDDDLARLDACVLTNAVRGITPVVALYHQGQWRTLSVCMPLS